MSTQSLFWRLFGYHGLLALLLIMGLPVLVRDFLVTTWESETQTLLSGLIFFLATLIYISGVFLCVVHIIVRWGECFFYMPRVSKDGRNLYEPPFAVLTLSVLVDSSKWFWSPWLLVLVLLYFPVLCLVRDVIQSCSAETTQDKVPKERTA